MDYIVIIMLMFMAGLLPVIEFFGAIFDDPLMFFLKVVIVVGMVVVVLGLLAHSAQSSDE